MPFSRKEIFALEGLDRDRQNIAFIGGSVADGFRNSWSDVDVYVITRRMPIGKLVRDLKTHRVSVHIYRETRFDFEFWPRTALQVIETKLARAKDRTTLVQRLLSNAEEVFAHRVNSRLLPLRGNVSKLRTRRLLSLLQYYQKLRAAYVIEELHEDVIGMIDSKDWLSCVLRARDLVDASIDAYLHALGNTNPNRKWRTRIAQELGINGAIFREYLGLAFPQNVIASGRSNAKASRRYCENAVAFSHKIAHSANL